MPYAGVQPGAVNLGPKREPAPDRYLTRQGGAIWNREPLFIISTIPLKVIAHSTMKCDRRDDVNKGNLTLNRLRFGQVATTVSKSPIKETIGCQATLAT